MPLRLTDETSLIQFGYGSGTTVTLQNGSLAAAKWVPWEVINIIEKNHKTLYYITLRRRRPAGSSAAAVGTVYVCR
jgi:hypothetical protein